MECVDKLECMFEKAECDLDLIYKKLENECGAHCKGVQDEDNPIKLLKCVSEIKQQYQAIVEDAKEIQKAQAEAMLFFKETLSNACQELAKLQMSTSLPNEKPEELSKIKELLDIDIPPVNAPSVNTEAAVFPSGKSVGSNSGDQELCSDSNQVKSSRDISAYEKRCASTEFLEITEEEFHSVSSVIRGRVKLSDVNRTYQILWNHFKDNKESAPLTRNDMYKMGLRVSGMTGEAKIKVLQALKLVSISKNGELMLL